MLQKTRKSLIRPGALPPVTVLDITTRDKDGGLIGRPAEWSDEMGVAPPSPFGSPRRLPAATARARRRSPAWATAFSRRFLPLPIAAARPIRRALSKSSTSAAARCSAVFKDAPGGGGRLLPIERRGEEMLIDPDDKGDAKDGDLVEVEVARLRSFGLPRAKVLSIVGSVASEKAISMIAIHAHGIPYIFPPAGRVAEADDAKPATMSHTAKTGATCR